MAEQWPFAHVLVTLAQAAAAAEVDMMLVGATARDVALAHEGQRGARRATEDVDIAVAVADQAGFAALVSTLEPARADTHHKYFVDGVEVDIVPFGDIESVDRTISWPDDTVMNTLGLAEAFAVALSVEVDGQIIRVASLASQAALKTLAWADRSSWTPRDAADLGTIIDAYSMNDRLDTIYLPANEDALAGYDYDVARAGAYLLGREISTTLGADVAGAVREIVRADLADAVLIPPALRVVHPDPEGLLVAYVDGLGTPTEG